MNDTKNKIHVIKLSPTEHIRYWFDEQRQLHTAVWSYEECIVPDTDSIFGELFKKVVKYILEIKECK